MNNSTTMSGTCAIVVTFNRKELLLRCLAGLALQIKPDNILVVDNASRDGTSTAVRDKFPGVTVLSLEKNVGGAGGFEAGLRWATTQQFDQFWLMDDDGLPSQLCLANLNNAMHKEDLDVVAPIVLTSGDGDELSFGLKIGSRFIKSYSKLLNVVPASNLVYSDANFFNGILIRRSAIEKVGFPNGNLFIRGDEVEYLFRVKHAQLRCATLAVAIFIHPSGASGKHPLLGSRFIACFTGNSLKDYCTYRNRAYIYLKYRQYHRLVIDCMRYAYFFGVKRKFDIGGLRFWSSATMDGVVGRFGRERQFLAG